MKSLQRQINHNAAFNFTCMHTSQNIVDVTQWLNGDRCHYFVFSDESLF